MMENDRATICFSHWPDGVEQQLIRECLRKEYEFRTLGILAENYYLSTESLYA